MWAAWCPEKGDNMLDNWNRPKRPVDAEIDEGVEEAKKRLADIQIQVKEKKLPVLVVLEGWDAAGKGSVLGKVIKDLDPRFFDVRTMDKPSEILTSSPFLRASTIAAPSLPPINAEVSEVPSVLMFISVFVSESLS